MRTLPESKRAKLKQALLEILRPDASASARPGKNRRAAFESLESRRLMTATANGLSAVVQGESYLLNLSQDSGSSATWKVNWGDGSIQTVAGTASQTQHVYYTGGVSPVITTELYKPDGTFAGFSPAEVAVGSDGIVFSRVTDGTIFRLDGQSWTQLSLNYTRFTVRNATEIWGVDAAGNVSSWNGTTTTPFPGRLLKNISIASDGTTWGIDTANVMVRRSGSTWTNMPGQFVDIEAASGGGAHGVAANGSLSFFYNNVWTNFSGILTDISQGNDGVLFGATSANTVYQWNGSNAWVLQSWANFKSLCANNVNDIWGIDPTGAVAHWNGSSLTKVPMTVTPVSVTRVDPMVQPTVAAPAVEGQPYVLDLKQAFGPTSQWIVNWGDGSTQTVAGNASQVAHVFADGPSTPTITTELYKPDGTFGGFSPAEVAVGSDGIVFARATDGSIFRLDGQSWTPLSLNYARFTVRNATEIWGVDAAGIVSSWNGTTTTPFPGRLLKNISIASDGTTWGIDTANVMVRRSGSSWTNMPGGLVDIEAANGGGAHGVAANGSLYYFYNNIWNSFTGILTDLSQGNDGVLFGATSANTVYQWNGTNTWVLQSWANFKSLCANNVNDIWGIDPTGAVAHWNGSSLSKIPTTVTAITVTNVVPTVQLQTNGPVIVGESYRPQLISRDSGTDKLTYVAMNWGDGSPVEWISATDQPSHRYATPGSYTVLASAFDEDNSIPPATATSTGVVVVEAERFAQSLAVGTSRWQRFASGTTSSVQGIELSAAPTTNYGNAITGSRVDYNVTFDRAGVQYAWLRMRSLSGTAAAVHLGLNGVAQSFGGQGISTFSTQWQWVRTVLARPVDDRLSMTTAIGSATLNLWAMNGQVQIDQLLLTLDAAFVPSSVQAEIRSSASGYMSTPVTVVIKSGSQRAVVPVLPAITANSQVAVLTAAQSTLAFSDPSLPPITAVRFAWQGSSVFANTISRGSLIVSSITSGGNATVTVGTSEDDQTIQYQLLTASGWSETRLLRLLVRPGISLPIATPDTVTLSQGSTLVVPVLANDFDPDQQLIQLSGVQLNTSTAAPTSSVVIAGVTAAVEDGNVRLTALATATVGDQIVQYFVDDASGNRVAEKLLIKVIAPPAAATTATFNSGTQVAAPAAKYLTRDDADISLPSIGIATDVERHYNAKNTDNEGFGTGWAFTYGSFLTIAADTNSFVWTKPSGATDTFTAGTTTAGITPFSNTSADGTTAERKVVNSVLSVIVRTKQGDLYTYQINGTRARLVEIKDRNDNIQTISYTGDLIAKVTESGNGAATRTRLTFTGAAGRITSIADDKGRVWNYEYSQTISGTTYLTKALMPASVVGGIRQFVQYKYAPITGAIGLLSSVTEKNGQDQRFDYYLNGRLATVSTAGQVVAQYRYDDTNSKREVIDGSGVVTVETYTAQNVMTERLFADGSKFTQTFDTNGRVLQSTQPGLTTVYSTYDAKGNLLTQKGTDSVYTVYEYDPTFGQVTKVTSDLDITPSVTTDNIVLKSRILDAHGNVTSETDATGNVTLSTYDARGQLISQTDPRGMATTAISDYETDFVYNPDGQLTQRLLPLAVAAASVTVRPKDQYSYDAFYNLLSHTDPTGIVTSYQFDRSGKLLSQSLPAPYASAPTALITNQFTYDNFGNVIVQTDGNGNRTQFEWDARTRLTRRINPDGSDVRITYDSNGKPLTIRDESGATSCFVYDSKGRLQTTIFPDGNKRTITYSNFDQPLTTTEANGATTTLVYNTSGQPIKKTDTGGAITQWTYNPRGQIATITDPLSSVTSFTYDNSGRVIQTQIDNQRIDKTTFDIAGNATAITFYDISGQTTVNLATLAPAQIRVLTATFDPEGRATSITNPAGGLQTITYNAAGRPITTTDVLGAPTQFTYDLAGRSFITTLPLATTGAAASTLTTYLDANGNVVSSVDANGYETRTQFDARNRPVRTVNALGQASAVVYDVAGHTIASIDPLGHVTASIYNSLGKVVKTRADDPDGTGPLTAPVWQYKYDAMGNVIESTDPLGRVTNRIYDADGRITKSLSPLIDSPNGQTRLATVYTYNGADEVLTKIDQVENAAGTITSTSVVAERTTTFTYTVQGRLLRQTSVDPDGTGTLTSPWLQNTYNGFGDLVSQTDDLTRVTAFAVDSLGRTTSVTAPDPDGTGSLAAPVTGTQYDAAGHIIKQTDPNGNFWQFTYDALGRQITTIAPDTNSSDSIPGATTTTQYDLIGNPIRTIDPLGRQTDRTFDALGRLLMLQLPAAVAGGTRPQWQTQYDTVGNVISITDPLGRQTTNQYDALYRLIATTAPDPDLTDSAPALVQQFGYDAAGRRIQSIDPLGRLTTYTYDAIDRPTIVTLPDLDNDPMTVAYKAETRYNDVAKTRSDIDTLGRTSVTLLDNLGRTIRETQPIANSLDNANAPITNYVYDSAGNLSRITDPLNRVTDFVYDKLDRKTSEKSPAVGMTLISPTFNWTYDAAGNVISTTDPLGRVTTNAYDAVNQLTSITHPRTVAADSTTAAVETFTYDLVGNTLSSTDALLRQTAFQYNNLDQLVLQTLPDPDLTDSVPAPTNQYQYDLVGNLTSSTDALGRVTTTSYDRLSRSTSIRLPNPTVGATAPGQATLTKYDQVGNVIQSTDVAGRMTSFTYDAWDRQTNVTLPDPDGSGPLLAPTESSAYDAANNVVSTTDPLGRITLYRYDNLNQLVGSTLPDPDSTDSIAAPMNSMRYDLVGNVIAATDTLGRQTNWQYDALNRLVVETLPNPATTGTGPQTKYTYDLVGNELTVTDALSRITSFTYDTRDQLLLQTSPDPDGAGALPAPVITNAYDKTGNLISQTDQLARTTTFQFDRLDRQTSVTYPDADTADAIAAPSDSTVYDKVGNVTATINARGNRTEFTYDAWNRQLSQRLPNPTNGTLATGPLSSQTYDLADNVLTTTDANTQTTTSTYDALDRLIQTTLPDPDGTGPAIASQTRYTYNAASELVSEIQRATGTVDLTTTNVYDGLGRKVQVTDPRGSVTRYGYDTEGNLTSLKDASLNTTTYVYDVLNRLITDTDPLSHSRTFEYDLVGNQVAQIDRNSKRTEFTYDLLDRVTSELWKAGTTTTSTLTRTIATTYNSAGLVAAVNDPDSTTSYSYDRLDQLTSSLRTVPSAPNVLFAYTYDIGGNLATTKQTIGTDITTTTYTVDALDRVTRIAQTAAAVRGVAADYTYTPTSQVVSIQRSQGSVLGGPATTNTVKTDFTYDLDDRQIGIAHKSGATTLAGYTLGFDAASRLTSNNSTLDGTATFTLDAAGELTAATRTTQPNESYSYDAAGNRTGTGVTIGPNNQVLNDGKFAYQYDLEGNRTRRTVLVGGAATGASTQYAYDQRNRLISVKEYSAANVLTANTNYSYDTNNQRLSRTVDSDGNGTTDISQRFVLDGDTVTTVLNAASSNAIQNRYLHGTQVDEILADINGTGNITWTLADNQKTVRDLSTFDGTISTIANHRVYDSYGKPLSQTNAAVDTLFGYTGRELDTQTGLNYYRDRWYDPAAGEFLTPDPIGFAGGDTNLTRYVGNAPNDYTDPTGNSWLSSAFHKVTEEITRVKDQIGNVFEDAWQDTRAFAHDSWEFVEEHPWETLAIVAAATFTWYVGPAAIFAAASEFASATTESIVAAFLPDLEVIAIGEQGLVTGAESSGVTLVSNTSETFYTGSMTATRTIGGRVLAGSILGGLAGFGIYLAGRELYNDWNEGHRKPVPPITPPSEPQRAADVDINAAQPMSTRDVFQINLNLSYTSPPINVYSPYTDGIQLPGPFIIPDQRVPSTPSTGRGNSAIQSVPTNSWGQWTGIVGAGLGNIGSNVSSFFTGLAGTPRAIISGDAGRALGERAIGFSSRVNGQPFNGSFKHYFDAGVMLTLDMTGLAGPVEGATGRALATGESLDGYQRGSRVAFGVAGAATAAAGGPAVVASTAAKWAGAAKLAAGFPAGWRKVVKQAGEAADEGVAPEGGHAVLAERRVLTNGDELAEASKPSLRGQLGQRHTYVNYGHHDPVGGLNPYNPRKTVLPNNHTELFEQSISHRNPNNGKVSYYTKDTSGNYHRFQADGNGTEFHWNGQTNGRTLSGRRTKDVHVPPAVRRQFGE